LIPTLSITEKRKPITVTERSKAWVCGRLLAGIVSSNPAGAWLSLVNFVFAGRGLCDGPIPRPEESHRVCVCESLRVKVEEVIIRKNKRKKN
jgi:hypothetical protein